MKRMLERLGFDKRTMMRFLLVILNSQLIYAFTAIRSVLYDPFLEALGVTNTQFGVLMGFIGFITVFGGLAVGWLQDRFSVRKILAVNTFMYGGWALVMSLWPGCPYALKCLFFISFGFNGDAMYWATVLKSVRTMAGENKQATAFGLMESLRCGIDVIIGAAAVAVYALTYIKPVEQFLAADRLLLLSAVELGCLVTVLWQAYGFVKWKLQTKRGDDMGANSFKPLKAGVNVVLAAVVYALTYVPKLYNVLIVVRLPVMTYLCIGALCCFNNILMRTRLGQNMRTVGQSRTVANAAGIDVDKTRIIAMIFSTVLASWGQLIFLQNVGTISTYGAHTQVGQFAIAALLVGGASVQRATNKQALLGIVLFHTLFIVSPLAGKELFGDPVIG